MANNLADYSLKPRVIFRADGNAKIGLGHVTRSLALASYIKDHFNCYFAIQDPSPEVLQQITASNLTPVLLPTNSDLLDEAEFLKSTILQESDILVLDGYNFNLAYQQKVKEAKVFLVCLDDIQAYPFVADAIINTAGGISPDQYQALPSTKFYLGPDYALLRAPFIKVATLNRNIAAIKKIFLNMGGADPDNHTCRIIQDILPINKGLQLEVVIGSVFIHTQDLQHLISNASLAINIHQNLSAEEMCALMQQCDAAILPPSSVSYEWCSVGGPLFLHQIAANQSQNQKFLLSNKLALPLADFDSFLKDPNKNIIIQDQINNQRKWFNGQSPRKLLSIFFQLAYQSKLTIRKADQGDMEILFTWANDPEVRRNSFSNEPIPLDAHQIWFKNKLRDTNCLFCIAEINNIPAGMVRFDMSEQQATISYLIDQKFRGKGLGTCILHEGLKFLKSEMPQVEKAVGFIEENNRASVKAFEKNNFIQSENVPAVKPGSLVFEKTLK